MVNIGNMKKYGFKISLTLQVIFLNYCFANIINVDQPSWWTHFEDRKLE